MIDFAVRPLEDAMQFPAALDVLRRTVKAEQERNRDRFRREHWWLLGRPVIAMRQALAPLGRYIAGTATGKRILFAWQDPWTCPSNAMNAFAFADDYSMGVLASTIHGEWVRAQSSTLEDRIRYTPTSAFETFPWPQPDEPARARVGELAGRLIALRQQICAERDIGLTVLYNQVDEGAYTALRDLHQALDVAVAAAYGWEPVVASDPAEANRRLLELNGRIAGGELKYAPFRET